MATPNKKVLYIGNERLWSRGLICHSLSWWRHQMETFPRYWPFVWGIHRSPVNSQHKGQWRGALMFSLICALINGWINNGETGDWRRHRAHYDVIVMYMSAGPSILRLHGTPETQTFQSSSNQAYSSDNDLHLWRLFERKIGSSCDGA